MANEEIREKNVELALRTAIKLFLEHGIQNTTREMIARESNLSRKSTERYFPTKTELVVQASEWVGHRLREDMLSFRPSLFTDGEHKAEDILKLALAEMRKLLLDEPRIFVCYAEFKAYLYRNSDDRARDYRRFMEAVDLRGLLKKTFELGQQDGTLYVPSTPESSARALTNSIMAYFSNVVLLYDTEPQLMRQYLDQYIQDTIKLYCID